MLLRTLDNYRPHFLYNIVNNSGSSLVHLKTEFLNRILETIVNDFFAKKKFFAKSDFFLFRKVEIFFRLGRISKQALTFER